MDISRQNGSALSTAQRFDALVRPHVDDLYRTAFRYTRRREDAEDLVQDLLTKLYQRTSELEAVQELRPWLTRALYNAFIDFTRKRQRTPQGTQDAEEAELAGPESPHNDVLRYEQRRRLQAAIRQLSPEHRAVVTLHLVEGHSLPELSELLSVRIGTLKSRLHRAKAQLRDALDSPTEPKPPEQRVADHEL